MIVLALMFAWSIFLNGSTFAAMHGRLALKLGLPGSAMIPHVAWVAAGVYLIAVVAMLRIKKKRTRWISFMVATVLGLLAPGYSQVVLDAGSVEISVRKMSEERRQFLETKYPGLKWVYWSSSSESCVRVGRGDYSPGFAADVTGPVDEQPTPGN